jgi:hypothetical protein
VAEAAGRFRRFLGREPQINGFGPVLRLDRGRVQLVDANALEKLVPRLSIPDLPFMAGYGLAVTSLEQTAASLLAGDMAFERRDGDMIALFPPDLGIGCWVFVEGAGTLPWRR